MAEDKDLIVLQRKYIELLCDRFSVTKSQLAKRAGLNHATITRIFNKNTDHKLGTPTLNKLYNKFGIQFVLDAEKVPLVGYSEGGRLIMFPEEEIKFIDGPYGDNELGVAAFEVRDNAMYSRYKQGEIVYYLKNGFKDNHYGEDCVVETEDGELLIRVVQKGAWESVYILEAYNAPLLVNVKAKSVSPIIGTRRKIK